jgi:hypothetical protein
LLLDGKIDDDDASVNPDAPTRAWAIAVGVLCGLPLYLLFSALGNKGRGTAASGVGIAIIIALWFRWELRRRVWFWILVSLIVALHLALILLIPWPNSDYTFPVVFPFGLLDYFVISFVLGWAAKRMGPLQETATAIQNRAKRIDEGRR